MAKQPAAAHSPFSGVKLREPKVFLFEWRQPIHKWYFNPWTGKKRHPGDVETDPHGLLIHDMAWGPLVSSTLSPLGAQTARHVLAFLDNLLDPDMYGHAVTPEIRRLAKSMADEMRAAGFGG